MVEDSENLGFFSVTYLDANKTRAIAEYHLDLGNEAHRVILQTLVGEDTLTEIDGLEDYKVEGLQAQSGSLGSLWVQSDNDILPAMGEHEIHITGDQVSIFFSEHNAQKGAEATLKTACVKSRRQLEEFGYSPHFEEVADIERHHRVQANKSLFTDRDIQVLEQTVDGSVVHYSYEDLRDIVPDTAHTMDFEHAGSSMMVVHMSELPEKTQDYILDSIEKLRNFSGSEQLWQDFDRLNEAVAREGHTDILVLPSVLRIDKAEDMGVERRESEPKLDIFANLDRETSKEIIKDGLDAVQIAGTLLRRERGEAQRGFERNGLMPPAGPKVAPAEAQAIVGSYLGAEVQTADLPSPETTGTFAEAAVEMVR